MNRTAALLLLALFAFACEEPRESQLPATTSTRHEDIPKYTTEHEPDYDTDNLLNLAYGTAVISRTAEATLENSAVHAIDSTMSTAWMSPPSSADHTIVFSMVTPARITRIGILATGTEAQSPSTLAYEFSVDGTHWQALKTVHPKGAETPQLWDVSPTVAQYLRVKTSGTNTLSVRSFIAQGQQLRTPVFPPIEGCYRINERPARFARDGASISGIIATDPPTLFDGGTDGSVAQLMWTQGPMWGYGAITISPNAANLSGLRIHEEISTQQYGEAWFGERIPCDGLTLTPPQFGSLTSHAPNDRWSMYGLLFDRDDRIVAAPSNAAIEALARRLSAAPTQRFRFVAHELRSASADENRQHTEKRVAALRQMLQSRGIAAARIELVSAGSEWKEPPIDTALQRLMASRIDLERVGR